MPCCWGRSSVRCRPDEGRAFAGTTSPGHSDSTLKQRNSVIAVERHEFAFSRRNPPELCIVHHPRKVRGCREGRVAAAPGAPAQKKFARAREPQVQADTHPPSLRSGLRLIRALPGEPAFATVVGAMRK